MGVSKFKPGNSIEKYIIFHASINMYIVILYINVNFNVFSHAKYVVILKNF